MNDGVYIQWNTMQLYEMIKEAFLYYRRFLSYGEWKRWIVYGRICVKGSRWIIF